jgi:hypothetical protein
MGRIILGAIVGYIVWTVLWLGSDEIIKALMPNLAPSADLSVIPNAYLVIKLISSFILSIISGFLAVLIAKEVTLSTAILGILLLLTGLFVQISAWNQIPLWYHIPFLILLIPMTILGGKLKKQEPIIS